MIPISTFSLLIGHSDPVVFNNDINIGLFIPVFLQ